MNLQTILNSMRKYQPHVYVLKISDPFGVPCSNFLSSFGMFDVPYHDLMSNALLNELTFTNNLMTFVFAETKFIAVTAYQNEQVSQQASNSMRVGEFERM